jgi:thiol-disulfide isomerase/thioredoxin
MAQTVKSDKNSDKRTKKAGKGTVTAPSTPADGSSKAFLLGILAILVIGLAAVAFVVTNRDGVDLDSPQTAAVQVEGTPLESMPNSGVSVDPASDPAIGAEPPAVTGTSFDGSDVSITNDGRAKAIYFLAHWCPHCQEELPRITQLIDEGKQPADLDVYAVSTDIRPERGNYPPVRWFDLEGFQAPVLRDSDTSEAYANFGPSGFPYAVYVNADNQVVARSSGQLDAETIEALWAVTSGARSADEVDSDAGTGLQSDPELESDGGAEENG